MLHEIAPTPGQIADMAFKGFHELMMSDLEPKGFREASYATGWTQILMNLPEVRRDGVYAMIDYEAEYLGDPYSDRFRAVLLLCYHRTHLYQYMMGTDLYGFDRVITVEIDSSYHLHLAWFMRFRDKFDADVGEEVIHTWLN